MASARVEKHVGAALGESRASAIGDPGVAADFKADAYTAAVEKQIAQRIFLATDLDAADDSRGPTTEPARLVVNAIAREMLLGDEAEQLAVASHGSSVIE